MTQTQVPKHPAGPEDRPDLNTPPLVVVPRPSLRKRLGLLPPLLIIAVALPVLAYRLLSPDWAWNRSAWNHWRSDKAAAPAPLALAHAPKIQAEPTAETPRPVSSAEPAKVVANTPEPTESKPAPVEKLAEANESASEPPPDAKQTNDSWDDIRREAERKQAEIARLEALKKQEADRLARVSPDHVERRGDPDARQREIEQFLDARIAAQRRMMNEMRRRMPMGFDQDADEMFNQLTREFQQRRTPMPGRAAPKQDRRRQPERSKRFSRQQRLDKIEIHMRFSDEVFHL